MISNKFNTTDANTDSSSTNSNLEPSTSSASDKKQVISSKGTICEGKRIKYLDKCDEYKEQLIEDSDEMGKKQDEYVLKKLFKNASLHSALQHDAIEGATSNDYIIVENEAERVANNAIRALQRSREMCLSASTGLPNWTGSNGYSKKGVNVGKSNRPAFGKATTVLKPSISTNNTQDEEESIQPSEFFSSIDRLNKPKPSSPNVNNRSSSLNSNNLPKNNLASSSLLDAIKQRNNIIDFNKKINSDSTNNENGRSQIDNLVQIEVEKTYQELLENLRLFISFKSKKNGEATTQEVLAYFSDKIKKEQTAVFKALLWKLCNFVRRDGDGYWVLKSEFR